MRTGMFHHGFVSIVCTDLFPLFVYLIPNASGCSLGAESSEVHSHAAQASVRTPEARGEAEAARDSVRGATKARVS